MTFSRFYSFFLKLSNKHTIFYFYVSSISFKIHTIFSLIDVAFMSDNLANIFRHVLMNQFQIAEAQSTCLVRKTINPSRKAPTMLFG
jgi:hypothetical protein